MSIANLLNGVAFGALLLILSSGLALIYGLRGVINFAHGALYMLGAYVAYQSVGALGFWGALVVAPLVVAVAGVALELGVFRPLEHRSHVEVGLVTFGLAMIIERVIVLIWGEDTLPVEGPGGLAGTVSVFGSGYPAYRLFIIATAAVMAVGLFVWLQRSRTGLHIRATSQDPEMAEILGVNVSRLSLLVMAVGGALAGVAGALAAPYFSVQPSMGQAILIPVLIVVVVGGVGSVGGAMTAALVLGIGQTLGNVWAPSVTVLLPYVLVIGVLLWRPTGIAGKRVV